MTSNQVTTLTLWILWILVTFACVGLMFIDPNPHWMLFVIRCLTIIQALFSLRELYKLGWPRN